ncbi:MAG: hypothetical protein IPJ75_07480 [Ignavibacteriales bacterium]|nr:hypothetical protein [Ignavibacteriales bacterium]
MTAIPDPTGDRNFLVKKSLKCFLNSQSEIFKSSSLSNPVKLAVSEKDTFIVTAIDKVKLTLSLPSKEEVFVKRSSIKSVFY